MKPINDFELIHHGMMFSDYFQGCGTSIYQDVATGIGADLNEAIDDALEQLAQSDWETEGMESRILKKYGKMPEVEEPENFDCHHYVSIRVR